jgi:hypothetical protein
MVIYYYYRRGAGGYRMASVDGEVLDNTMYTSIL